MLLLFWASLHIISAFPASKEHHQSFQSINQSNNHQSITITIRFAAADLADSTTATTDGETGELSYPSIEDIKNMFREKCINVSGSESAYDEAIEGSKQLVQCATGLVNVTQLSNEIEAAKPIGELDTVFQKYCQKKEAAVACFTDYTNSVKNCYDDDEQKLNTLFVKIIKSLLEFACHRDGDAIALFIAEKGPECLAEKKESLIACASNNTTDINSLISLKNFKPVFGVNCGSLDVLKNCIVNELEKCEESTPANMFEAVFKVIAKEKGCPVGKH